MEWGFIWVLFCCFVLLLWSRRSGTAKAANGEAVLPIVVVGRIDIAGAVEVEVVGVAAVRVWSRRPVVAVVAGVGEQVAGILIDVAARLPNDILRNFDRSCFSFP